MKKWLAIGCLLMMISTCLASSGVERTSHRKTTTTEIQIPPSITLVAQFNEQNTIVPIVAVDNYVSKLVKEPVAVVDVSKSLPIVIKSLTAAADYSRPVQRKCYGNFNNKHTNYNADKNSEHYLYSCRIREVTQIKNS